MSDRTEIRIEYLTIKLEAPPVNLRLIKAIALLSIATEKLAASIKKQS